MRASVITLLTLLAVSAHADYNGSITFSTEEVTNHKEKIKELVDGAQNCLLDYKAEHKRFYNSNCVSKGGSTRCLSKYYGERRYSKKRFQRRDGGLFLTYLPTALRRAGFDRDLVNEMEPISCVGLALTCLERGFNQTGQSAQWDKIMRFVRANNVGGTSLQHALQQLGWEINYWNPASEESASERMAKWDEEENKWQSKGWHAYRYNNVMTRGTYWFNKVDNATDLVGFEKETPAKFSKYPFWVGTANTGYHVFPGTFEKVVEAHSTRHITSFDNLEFSPFNPLAGQGPKWTPSEKYRSGLIAFPPL